MQSLTEAESQLKMHMSTPVPDHFVNLYEENPQQDEELIEQKETMDSLKSAETAMKAKMPTPKLDHWVKIYLRLF